MTVSCGKDCATVKRSARGCLTEETEGSRANQIQQIFKFGRQTSSEFQLFTRAWMTKAELLRMKELTMQFRNAAANFCIRHSLVTPAAIDLISHNRVLKPSEVHANLMRTSCLQFDIK